MTRLRTPVIGPLLNPAADVIVVIFAATLLLALPLGAAAQERLCDTQFEDCRAPVLDLIRNERIGIDVAFWVMEEAQYVTEPVNRHNAGVPVRILVDQRANATKRLNEAMLTSLRDAASRYGRGTSATFSADAPTERHRALVRTGARRKVTRR
jgi:hypothetical protein